MSFWDKMELFVNESVKFSKQTFEKAKDLGNITKKEFELKSLQNQAQKIFTELGGTVHQLLTEKNKDSISLGDEEVNELVDKINSIEKSIEEKETEIENLRKSNNNE